jgi:sugar/nucleoside kinase (ribokinase family)
VAAVEWGTSRWIDRPLETVGGHGANTSTALAVLGVPVQLIGLTGADPSGDFLRRRLAESGVDLVRLGRSPTPTTVSIVVVHPSGERASLNYPGAAGDVTAESVLSALDGAGHSHFHLATFFALPKCASRPRPRREAPPPRLATLDPNWDARRWRSTSSPASPTSICFW